MKERNAVIIFVLVFILLGIGSIFLNFLITKFNFYKTELTINNKEVQETLFFKPKQDYHTLYRDFVTKTDASPLLGEDSIVINSVRCQAGTAYFNTYSESYTSNSDNSLYKTQRFAYTESNEYGCSFGNEFGFKRGQKYWIGASYSLSPTNLIKIKDRYYLKFIAYSVSRHKLLIKNINFFVDGNAITKKLYAPGETVIIYIPFEGDTSKYSTINQNSFEYESSIRFWLAVLFSFLPAVFFFLIWWKFGRELSYAELPLSLSVYPQDRKGWEVAAFFNPPFSVIDKNFFASAILDLYNRKIIDLKQKEKDTYIKIINKDKPMDEIESKFIKILVALKDKLNAKHIDEEGYANIKKLVMKAKEEQDPIKELEKKIKKKGKEYMETKAKYVPLYCTVILIFLGALIKSLGVAILAFISLVLTNIISSRSSILIRFKEDYYKEYQHWKAFRNYLNDFPSMRGSLPKGVILWEHYLVYAVALGVSKKVLKKLKEWRIIDDGHYGAYMGVYHVSPSFASLGGASGAAGHGGGGFGGAGGGGVGGGGGGGR